jgi:hypothetical protein
MRTRPPPAHEALVQSDGLVHDPAAGGANSNLSDAIEITFVP